jgi:hypothetical protein
MVSWGVEALDLATKESGGACPELCIELNMIFFLPALGRVW